MKAYIILGVVIIIVIIGLCVYAGKERHNDI